ncbi:MAG: MFS transporter [Elusimicrobia bacterium]|nr:MFS transporter [Elusimicrobiota bacterium]
MKSPRALFAGLPGPFVVLWWGTLINRLACFVIPFLSLYLTQERGYSIARVGAIASLYGAGHLLAGPVGGILADRVGRRPMMIFALFSEAAAVLVLGLSRSGPAICAAVFAMAFLGGMYVPASSAMVADLLPAAQRPRAYGLLYWAINLGFSAGMIMAGLLMKLGYAVLFTADAATTVIFALLVLLRVPESKPEGFRARPKSILAPLRDPGFAGFFLLALGVALIYNQANCTMAVDMQKHGVSAAHYGWLIALNCVLVAVLQPWIGARVLAASAARTLAAAAIFTGIGFGMCALGGSLPLYAASVVIWTLGEILGAPVAPSVVAELAPPDLRGTYQGAFMMAFGGGGFLAPLAGALVMARWGAPALWTACLGLGVLVAAGHLTLTEALTRRQPRAAREPGLDRRPDLV